MERPDLVERVLALLAKMSDEEVVALVRANLPPDDAAALERGRAAEGSLVSSRPSPSSS